MDLEFGEQKRRHVSQLQLASMIDIFTLIIVFLMKGTVLGGVSVNFPATFTPPQSSSTEAMEAAPQVIIFNDEVEFAMISERLKMASIEDGDGVHFRKVMGLLRKYIKDLPNDINKQSLSQVNVVADAKTSYDKVFAVIKRLREAGYTSMLFIAQGESKK
jgi:biopolymer transport protein ExbD